MKNKDILLKFISNQGYKRNSPDVNNPINVIPSPSITMKDVDFPVEGTDNYGNTMVMQPGGEYTFPGDYVVERPLNRFEDGGPSKVSNSSQLNPIVQYYADEMYKRFGKVILTDKATNTTYYGTKKPDGTWDLAQFEVLTGKAHGINDQKNDLTPRTVDEIGAGKGKKITAIGTYGMTPYNYTTDDKSKQGTKGFKLDETSNGESYTAYHVTYSGEDDKTRDKLYDNNSNEDNYRSFGCVNCEKPSIQALEKFIGKDKGHTLIIDTRLSLKENDQWIRKNTPQNSFMPPAVDYAGSYTRSQTAANAGTPAAVREKGDPKVRELQKQLNQQLGANLVVDGIRGPKTKAAEEKYNDRLQRQELYANAGSYASGEEMPVIPMDDRVAEVPQKDITVPTPTAGAKVPVATPVAQNVEAAPVAYSEPMGEGMAPYRKPLEGAPYSEEQLKEFGPKDSFYLAERKDGGEEGMDWEAINNIELAAKAKAMGHDSIASYRKSNWGYGPNAKKGAMPDFAKERLYQYLSQKEDSVFDNRMEGIKRNDENFLKNAASDQSLIEKVMSMSTPDSAVQQERINLTKGRFNTGSVSTETIDKLLAASKRQGVDPYVMLGLAGRESTFGKGYGSGEDNLRTLVSGWDVADPYLPYDLNRFLADKKVPGVSTSKTFHGWDFKAEDMDAINKHLQTHPELINQYLAKVRNTAEIGDLNTLDMAAQKIRKNGVAAYNPGDPRYEQMVQDDIKLIKSDPAMMKYLKSKGINEFGGMLDEYGQGGDMIKRADGSYSQRGFWDNIRDNKGSGKKPTKEMLAMDRKLNKKAKGGQTSDERDMVNGIADILSQVEDPQNRAAIARQMQKDFANEDVTYNLQKFLRMSNLEEGGEMEEFKDGGGIPERYKNMGFTKVGVKKQSTSAGKKWMVLAKKGDQYKVVHGGYDGMKDYTQHGSEDRRDRFWDRMGGRDSAKANDPFSPLYWHKRFGTWAEGGELPEMQWAGTAKDTSGPTPTFLTPEGNMNYMEMMNKLKLRQELEGAQARIDSGENFMDFAADRNKAGQLYKTMLERYPNDKRLTAKEDGVREAVGKQLIEQGVEKIVGVPILYDLYDIPNDMNSLRQAQNDAASRYANYTDELAANVAAYEKKFGIKATPSVVEQIKQSMGLTKKADGGNAYDGQYSDMYQEGDFQADTTRKFQVSNLKDSNWNKGLAGATALTDPRNGALQYLPDEGFGSGLKAILGVASGIAGATLGYEKLFAKPKTDSKLYNASTEEFGNTQEILKARYDKTNPIQPGAPDPSGANTNASRRPMTRTGGSGMGAVFGDGTDQFGTGYPTDIPAPIVPTPPPMNEPAPKGSTNYEFLNPEMRYGGLQKFVDAGTTPPVSFQQWFVQNATRQDVMSNSANRALLEQMWRAETGQAATTTTGQTTDQKIGTPNAPFANTTAGQTVTMNQNQGTPVRGAGPGSGIYGMDQGLYDFENSYGTDIQQPGPALPPPPKPTMQQTYSVSEYGDNAGFVGATNALNGLGIANNVLGARQNKESYKQRVRNTGNTDEMYNAYNPKNAYGKFTTNVGLGSNYALVLNTPTQDFSDVGAKYGGMKNYREGGSYDVSREEILKILAAGGEIEFL